MTALEYICQKCSRPLQTWGLYVFYCQKNKERPNLTIKSTIWETLHQFNLTKALVLRLQKRLKLAGLIGLNSDGEVLWVKSTPKSPLPVKYVHPPIGGSTLLTPTVIIKQKTTLEYTLAKQLYTVLASHRKIMRRPNLSSWSQEFRFLLNEGVTKEEIEQTLTWYKYHLTDKYCPIAYSAKTFREKWPRIQDSIKRYQEKCRETNTPYERPQPQSKRVWSKKRNCWIVTETISKPENYGEGL